MHYNMPQLELVEERWRFFMQALDVDEVLGQLLAYYFETVSRIAKASPDILAEIVCDEAAADEIRSRARAYMADRNATDGPYR